MTSMDNVFAPRLALVTSGKGKNKKVEVVQKGKFEDLNNSTYRFTRKKVDHSEFITFFGLEV
jgi:hypothetical protein